MSFIKNGLLFILICFFTKVQAQDTIILKSGANIIARVIEKNSQFITYSKSIANTNVNLKVTRHSIVQINYQNGTVEKFDKVNELQQEQSTKNILSKTIVQATELTTSLVDSFKMPAGKFGYFDLIKSKSPLIGFTEGIFMVNERIWFFKVPKSSKLNGFAISHQDTSMYVFYDSNNHIYLKNYKIDVTTGKQIESNLLTLDKKHQYTLYPLDRLNYYLLAKDSLSNLFLCSTSFQKRILSSKKKIYGIFPLDAANFIACYIDELVLYSIKNVNARVLFHSDLPIRSAALYTSGAPIVSTSKGIFIVNMDYTTTRIGINVYDGVLKVFNNYLYVLSNKDSAIYKVKFN